MNLFLNPKVIALAVLASLAPFAIDTYLPGFHIIATDLSSTPAYVQQSLTFYLIPYTIMTLFHGAISDSIGRITTIKWGLALFFFASIGCAVATSVEQLWFFRALQGIGGGAGNVVARAMVRDLYEGAQAQRVMATIQIIFGIAPAVAPIFGGFLLDYGWQSIFIFLALYAAIAIYYSSSVLPETMLSKDRLPFDLKSIAARYRTIFKNKEFLLLILSLSANFSAFFLYVLASPIFLIDLLGFTEKQFAYLFVPTVCGMIIGSFIAKKTKTWEEEKEVAEKAPVDGIVINDLNEIKIKKEKNKPRKFLYSIKIADFYYEKSAIEMIKRIKNETLIKKYKILSLSKTNFRVILGPFNDINSLKNSYNKASILNFENLEIIRHD